MEITIDALVRSGFEIFKKQVEEKIPEGDGDAAPPAWLMLESDKTTINLIVTPFTDEDDSKNYTAMMLRQFIRDKNIIAYAFFCEAWTVNVHRDDWHKSHPKPRNCEGRKEIISIVAVDREHNMCHGRADITPTEGGKRTVGELIVEVVDPDDMKGRFSNLFEE